MYNRLNYSANLVAANLLYAQPNNEKYLQYGIDPCKENQQRDGINGLPSDILIEIFSKLTLKCLSNINSVSKRWSVIENDRLYTLIFLSCIEGKQIFTDIFSELNNYFIDVFPKSTKDLKVLLQCVDNRTLLLIFVEVFMKVHQSQNKKNDIYSILQLYKKQDCSKLSLILSLFEHLTLHEKIIDCSIAQNAHTASILIENFKKINRDLFSDIKTDSTGFALYLLAWALNLDKARNLKIDALILKFLITSSKKGFPDAFWKLGDIYCFKDNPSAEDNSKAQEYYQKGADLKCPTAYHRLYLMSYNDDKEICHKYLSLAAEAGNKDAQFDLGDFYMRGNPSFERNIEKGFEYLEKAACQNHIEAAFRLCIYYSMGVNTKKNNEKAHAFFNKVEAHFLSNKLLEPKYVFYMGLLCEEGRGREKDLNRAKKYYERAAEKGCVKSLFSLGTFIEEGDSAFNVDLMMKYFIQAADKGHSSSQFKMCQIFSIGLYDISQDLEKARHYFKLLNSEQQDQDEGLQLGDIGNCYLHGYGVEKDLKMAYQYFHEAADLNHANAEFKLCCYYHKENDFEKSQIYFNLLNDPYHPQEYLRLNERYRNISYCYAHGIGTKKDERQAYHYKKLEQETGMRFLSKTWI